MPVVDRERMRVAAADRAEIAEHAVLDHERAGRAVLEPGDHARCVDVHRLAVRVSVGAEVHDLPIDAPHDGVDRILGGARDADHDASVVDAACEAVATIERSEIGRHRAARLPEDRVIVDITRTRDRRLADDLSARVDRAREAPVAADSRQLRHHAVAEAVRASTANRARRLTDDRPARVAVGGLAVLTTEGSDLEHRLGLVVEHDAAMAVRVAGRPDDARARADQLRRARGTERDPGRHRHDAVAAHGEPASRHALLRFERLRVLGDVLFRGLVRHTTSENEN